MTKQLDGTIIYRRSIHPKLTNVRSKPLSATTLGHSNPKEVVLVLVVLVVVVAVATR
jgi:hypothetical protein